MKKQKYKPLALLFISNRQSTINNHIILNLQVNCKYGKDFMLLLSENNKNTQSMRLILGNLLPL